jgi:hypothetical protein
MPWQRLQSDLLVIVLKFISDIISTKSQVIGLLNPILFQFIAVRGRHLLRTEFSLLLPPKTVPLLALLILILFLLLQFLDLNQLQLLFLFLWSELVVFEPIIFHHEGNWLDLVIFVKLFLLLYFMSDAGVVLARKVHVFGYWAAWR